MKRYVQPYLPNNKEEKIAGICKNCGKTIYLNDYWYHLSEGKRACKDHFTLPKAEPSQIEDYFNQLSTL